MMKIAILGTRGVPPCYGGFETFAAELGARLVERGHQVVVYCRSGLYDGAGEEWRGIRRVELPAVEHKYLETVSHTFVSTLHLLGEGCDAALLCNAANAFVLPLLRGARIPVAVNVDGIERNRRKWNALGRGVYLAGEALTTSLATRVVADARVIRDYYAEQHGVVPEVHVYGSRVSEETSDVLERFGLEREKYALYVSRFEPENNPLEVATGWRDVQSDLPIVMVGDAPYSDRLIEEIRSRADPRVLLTGALYGADYATLQRNALFYVQATEVGGTHPALIEAMAAGGAVLANDTPENREVGEDAILYFRFDGSSDSFSAVAESAIENPELLSRLREKARRRAAEVYDWERVTDGYERLFHQISIRD